MTFIPDFKPVGQISTVGQAFVFGLGLHPITATRNDTIYLDIVGSPTTIEAIWANIVSGETLTFVSANSKQQLPIRHSQSRQKEAGSPYLPPIQTRLPGLAWDHLVLVDRRFRDPLYAETGTTYLFNTPDAAHKLFEHIHHLVNLPVFPEWAIPLTQAGLQQRLVRPLTCFGPQLLLVDLNRQRWEMLICAGLKNETLIFPR